jgi:hypothetical protein
LIGYTPRSKRGARAQLDLQFDRDVNSSDTTAIFPRGAEFQSSFDGSSYVFTTLTDVKGSYDSSSNRFLFSNVEIAQGELKTLKFLVDNSKVNQKFIIEDRNIDTSTLQVRVFDHQNTSAARTFISHRNLSVIEPTDQVYFLSENYDGFYQLEFGDGIIGTKLDNLNVIEVSFLSTSGQDANGASAFSFLRSNDAFFNNDVGQLASLNVLSRAGGGDDRESINEIRRTAPYAYISQDRGVTENDYEALIRENISNIEALSVWGGQFNSPPIYGKVFISAKPKDSFFLTTGQKNEILDLLKQKNVLTVTPEIVDPNYTFLFFDIFFRYNSSQTSLSQNQLESRVRNSIQNYNNTFLENFDKIFRYSTLLDTIDNSDSSILNSLARIYAYKEFGILANNRLPSEIDFKFELFGDVNQQESILSTTSWSFNNQRLFLADEPLSTSTTERRVYAYRVGENLSTQIKVFPDVGRLNPTTGKLQIDALSTLVDTVIEIRVIPNSYDVVAIQNQLLSINIDKTNIEGSAETRELAANNGYRSFPRFRNE